MIIEKKESLPLDMDGLPEELRNVAAEAQKIVELRNIYRSAVREVSTKLEILDDEFHVKNDYNPIHHMESRVKSIPSILDKAERKGIEPTVENLRSIKDLGGVRVICNYVEDIYRMAELLLRQDDIRLIRRKDYIEHPKDSGYRSLHLVVEVPVFLAEYTERVPVEIQIRTTAMDTWASLEHELKYKRGNDLSDRDVEELKACATAMADVDERMQRIHKSTELMEQCEKNGTNTEV